MKFKNKIYIPCLLPYPNDTVPGQRFRWEQWESLLKKENIFLKKIFFSDNHFINLKNRRNIFIIIYYFFLYIKFLTLIILNCKNSTFIIFRNCTIGGPPIIEIFLKIIGKKIIFDFDDAIQYGSENNNNWFFSNLIRCDWKIKMIIKISNLIIAGNKNLKKFAIKYNNNVQIIPTTIDINKYKFVKKKYKKNLTIGWSGSSSTSKYIENFLPTLLKIQKKIKFKILIIGSKLNINNSYIKSLRWSSKNELKYLNQIDVGLMPLPNNQWTKGKCGLKILQYLSVGIPSVVSNVAINSEIIIHGKNGYLINNKSEWEIYLTKFLKNPKIISKMGLNGRKIVKKSFSNFAIINKLSKILRI
jgi:glycosyltransferase involved in cell wall biosynthesis